METKEVEKTRRNIINIIRRCRPPKRYIVTLMAFLGMAIAFCLKVDLSVAIVAMVNQTKITAANTTYHESECPGLMDRNKTTQMSYKEERYNWDPAQQGLILSAYFYGYSVTMFPGGYIAAKFGAVRLFGLCNLTAALFTLLIPVVVRWGLVPFLCIRFLIGLSEGSSYSCALSIVGIWSPKMERSRMTSIIFAGSSIGNVIAFTLSGILSSSSFLGGWASVFYFFGALGCIWYLFWIWLIYESPQDHPTISKDELQLFDEESKSMKKSRKIPWKSIIICFPFWAIVFSSIGNLFGVSIVLTEIPTYLNSILHFNLKASGFLTALPNISQAFGAWLFSIAADKIRASNKFQITTVRKVFNSIAGFGPTICLIVIAYSGCNSILIVALLCLQLFLNGFKYSGFMTSIVDMSPDFAGILHGLATGAGTIAASFAPNMAGAILTNGVTIANWGKVFCITAGVYFTTTTIYAIFGTSELQSWAKIENESSKEDECQLSLEKKRKKRYC